MDGSSVMVGDYPQLVRGLLGADTGDLVKQMSQIPQRVYYEPKEAKVRESIAVGYCSSKSTLLTFHPAS